MATVAEAQGSGEGKKEWAETSATMSLDQKDRAEGRRVTKI
jgi:hypothetical protein